LLSSSLRARQSKATLLFEKRSKNFGTAVADHSATAAQKCFGSFFQEELLFRPDVSANPRLKTETSIPNFYTPAVEKSARFTGS
jgi:hypothetical protein